MKQTTSDIIIELYDRMIKIPSHISDLVTKF